MRHWAWALMVVAVPATATGDASIESVDVDLILERSMSRSPGMSLAPDLYLELEPEIEISLVHSHRARWLIGTGYGGCFDCDELFVQDEGPWNGTGLAGRWHYGLAGLHFDDFSPLKPWLQLGGYYQHSWGWLSIETQPYVGIALANRDQGNFDFFNIPARIRAAPVSFLRISFEPAFNSRIEDFLDWYALSIGGGVEVLLPADFEVGVYLGFPRAYGQLNDSGDRHLAVSLGWHGRP
ncbi:MAG: hypothetical protein KJO07_24450 [Deltaproteobacteria bacterium]|nr:hypothetical protein [Deltaproteobacteria bacterium]